MSSFERPREGSQLERESHPKLRHEFQNCRKFYDTCLPLFTLPELLMSVPGQDEDVSHYKISAYARSHSYGARSYCHLSSSGC